MAKINEIAERWHRARNGGPGDWTIGGSEAAAVLGWDTWTDPIELYGRKLGLIPRGGDSMAAAAGRRFEAAILEWYADETERRLVSPELVARMLLQMSGAGPETGGPWWSGHDPRTVDATKSLGLALHSRVEVVYHDGVRAVFRCRARRWCAMTPDAFAFDQRNGWGVVDAKNLHHSKAHDWKDGIPADKAPQIAHYTAGFDLAWGGFACVFGGQTFKAFDATQADMGELIELLDGEVPRFIEEHLEAGIPPTATPTKASADALAKLYPHHDERCKGWVGPLHMADGTIWHPDEFDDLWDNAHADRKNAQDEIEGMHAVLRQVAQSAGSVALPSGSVYVLEPRLRRVR